MAAVGGHVQGRGGDGRKRLDEKRLRRGYALAPARQPSAARTKVGRRKLRLFIVACFRQIWEVLPEPARRVVELLNSRPTAPSEGPMRREQAEQLGRDNRGAGYPAYLAAALLQATGQGSPGQLAYQVSIWLAAALVQPSPPHQLANPELVVTSPVTHRRHADLLREIFGNPFRPPPRRKFPAEIRGLAQACYDDHAHYPVLAELRWRTRARTRRRRTAGCLGTSRAVTSSIGSWGAARADDGRTGLAEV